MSTESDKSQAGLAMSPRYAMLFWIVLAIFFVGLATFLLPSAGKRTDVSTAQVLNDAAEAECLNSFGFDVSPPPCEVETYAYAGTSSEKSKYQSLK